MIRQDYGLKDVSFEKGYPIKFEKVETLHSDGLQSRYFFLVSGIL